MFQPFFFLITNYSFFIRFTIFQGVTRANITTDHQKCTFFKHFIMFSIVLAQFIKSQSILFTTQNKCFIYIVSFTVTAFHNSYYQTFDLISFCSV